MTSDIRSYPYAKYAAAVGIVFLLLSNLVTGWMFCGKVAIGDKMTRNGTRCVGSTLVMDGR